MSDKICPDSEWFPEFIRRMKNAMTLSFFKYGPLAEAYPHKVNAIKELKRRLAKYEETGNADYLTDVANFAMIEAKHPLHPNFHYSPTDGGEGRTWHNGPPTQRKNNGDRQ